MTYGNWVKRGTLVALTMVLAGCGTKTPPPQLVATLPPPPPVPMPVPPNQAATNLAIPATDQFGTRLTFGTAGLRGEIGPGPARMNRQVIIQTSAGFAKFLAERAARGDGELEGERAGVLQGGHQRGGRRGIGRDGHVVLLVVVG